ncbi:hypothetical protein DV517_20670 [Streptomyces sp. S816]|nr:hypothetical protein DV517_20670 [Streptomyces sp. S816]
MGAFHPRGERRASERLTKHPSQRPHHRLLGLSGLLVLRLGLRSREPLALLVLPLLRIPRHRRQVRRRLRRRLDRCVGLGLPGLALPGLGGLRVVSPLGALRCGALPVLRRRGLLLVGVVALVSVTLGIWFLNRRLVKVSK